MIQSHLQELQYSNVGWGCRNWVGKEEQKLKQKIHLPGRNAHTISTGMLLLRMDKHHSLKAKHFFYSS